MLKKTVTYEDFDGTMKTGDYYFNLTKAELTKIRLGDKGYTFEEAVQAIIDSQDTKKIVETFEMIILAAYGDRIQDGEVVRFMKSEEIAKNFKATAAYSEVFMSLFETTNATADFIKAVVPPSMAAEAEAAEAREKAAVREDGRPALQDHLKKAEPVAKRLEEPTVIEVAAPVLEAIDIPKLADEDLEYQQYREQKRLEREASAPKLSDEA